ncbi:MAG: 3-dehydroquinate synthase [Proteobacteria bacterium]|nr:3-dehydroquinate synthase [Pseudomonadota bacterium]MBU2262149.1 3-dehydroquinate synthase [Pseudomonadota bacterium]
MKTMKVNLDRMAANSYTIHIGDGIMDRMGLILARSGVAQRYVIVTDDHVDALHGGRVQAALEKADLIVDRIAVAPGEAAKDIRTVLALAEKLTGLGADRHTALVALGGGVVGDLTGFVASIYMRGIPVIQVPTTLLAQVDSSIGGKTGVDIAAGKNLLGTFHQPKGVFIDIDFLRMLPEAQLRNGLAEVIKCAVIESPELLDDIEDAAAKGGLRETAFLERVITTACRIKKELVEIDERDRGLRRILNFGHTLGHAVEAASGYALSHGESVAIGMVASAAISERMHYLPTEDRKRIESVIRAVGLPDRIPGKLAPGEIMSRLASDKKKEGETIHFILLKKLGLPFVNGGVPEGIVRETIKRLQR